MHKLTHVPKSLWIFRWIITIDYEKEKKFIDLLNEKENHLWNVLYTKLQIPFIKIYVFFGVRILLKFINSAVIFSEKTTCRWNIYLWRHLTRGFRNMRLKTNFRFFLTFFYILTVTGFTNVIRLSDMLFAIPYSINGQ